MKRLVVVALLLLVGCGVKTGEVNRKWHEDANTYVVFIPFCNTVGKVTVCNTIPMQQYDDEDWVLELENDGKWGEVYVDESTYMQAVVGDWFDGHTLTPHDSRRPVQNLPPEDWEEQK